MKDRVLDLDDYLTRLKEKGRHDSEGVFTVAGNRALGKLSQFLLPEKSDWILKMVQAGCCAEASGISLKQTHRSTQIEVIFPHQIDLDRFENALTTPTVVSSEPGSADLIVGLRAVGVGQQRDWVASLTAGRAKSIVTCVEGQVTSERLKPESPVDGTHIQIGVSYPQSESGKIGGLIRFGEAVQNEHTTLLSRVRACPIPISLDGRRLDDLCEPSLSSALRPRVFLGINFTSQQGDTPIRVPPGLRPANSRPVASEFHSPAPFLVPMPPAEQHCTSIQRWFYNYSRREEPGKSHIFQQAVPTPSRVYLVRHGVIVGRRNLGFTDPISSDVFLCADHLRSDLTGLSVDPEEAEVEIAREGLRQSRQFLQELSYKLEQTQSRPFSKDLLFYGGLGALTLLSPWFAVKALTGTVTGVMLARAVKADKRVLADCIEKIDAFLTRIPPPGMTIP